MEERDFNGLIKKLILCVMYIILYRIKCTYHPSRKPGSLLGGGATYWGGAITGGPW